MNGRFAPFRHAALACAALALVTLGLHAQSSPPVTAPTATALRAYSQGFREPVRLATDPAGQLYVADPRLGVITLRDESGKLIAVKRGFAKPLGLAVDASGRIFVCEAGKGRVSIFTPGWVPAGALGQGDGEFQMPNHIQITSEGLVYVVDSAANLVKVYGPNGVLVRQFGGYGALPGLFDFPTGLTVTPAGEIVVSDQGNERIQVFDLTGTFVRAFGKKNMIGTNSTFGRVQGLHSDAQGRIFLADSFRGQVSVINSLGTTLGTISTFGSDPGQLTGPACLVVDRNNRLFVAAPGNTRVELFGLDTYTDPHILFANLSVLPPRLDRTVGTQQHLPTRRHHLRNPRERRSHEGRDDDDDRDEGGGGRPEAAHRNLVAVLIKLSGVDPASILASSITANGLPPTPVPGAFVGDFDGDGLFEYRVWFDKGRLLATMPDGEAFLVLSGRLSDGRVFEGIADVSVVTPTGGVQ